MLALHSLWLGIPRVLASVGVLLVTNRMFYFRVMAQRLFSRLGLNLWRFF